MNSTYFEKCTGTYVAMPGEHIDSVISNMIGTFKLKNVTEITCEFNDVTIKVDSSNFDDPESIKKQLFNTMNNKQIEYYASEEGLKALQKSADKLYENQTKANIYFNKAMKANTQHELAKQLCNMAEYTDYHGVSVSTSMILNKMEMLNCNTNYEFGKNPGSTEEFLSWFFSNIKSMFNNKMPIHPVLAEKVLIKL